MRRLNLSIVLMMLVAGCAFYSETYEQPEPGVHCESFAEIVGLQDKNVQVRCWMNSQPNAEVWFLPQVSYSDSDEDETISPSSAVVPEYVTITPDVWKSEIRFNVQCSDDEELKVSILAESMDGDYDRIKIDDVKVDCSSDELNVVSEELCLETGICTYEAYMDPANAQTICKWYDNCDDPEVKCRFRETCDDPTLLCNYYGECGEPSQPSEPSNPSESSNPSEPGGGDEPGENELTTWAEFCVALDLCDIQDPADPANWERICNKLNEAQPGFCPLNDPEGPQRWEDICWLLGLCELPTADE